MQTAFMRGMQLLLGMMLLGSGSRAAADEPSICANRPGLSTPSCTVPAGHFQIETGLADWTLQKSGGERDSSLVLGETLLIFGLTDRSDIEFDITPWQRATSSGPAFRETARGFGDVNVLYKHLLTASDAKVQVAALPFVKLPTAKHSLGNGKWEGGLLIPIDYSIPKSPFSIGLTPEVDWVADADGRGHHAAMVQVVNLGWQVNNRLSLSGGLWGQWDWDPTGTTKQVSADATAAYLVKSNLQLDAGANFGLNSQTPDIEVYTGISVRF